MVEANYFQLHNEHRDKRELVSGIIFEVKMIPCRGESQGSTDQNRRGLEIMRNSGLTLTMARKFEKSDDTLPEA